MQEDFFAEPKDIRCRVQQLFNEFYHAGISEPMAWQREPQASPAAREDAAGGKHEYKD